MDPSQRLALELSYEAMENGKRPLPLPFIYLSVLVCK